jgi:ribosome-associated toxin RatA of RatAB toxin-antitoxin module
MPAATRSVDIDAPLAAVMDVIVDFGAYPSFLPDIEHVDILRSGPTEWEVRFTARVIRRLVYTLRLVRQSEAVLEWSLVEGVFRANDGGWTLEPLPDGRTRANYRIDIQVGIYVPGNILRSLVDQSLPDTLDRFKAEAERRARAGSDPGGG